MTRVALIGAGGHGKWHRRRIASLEAAGLVRLVGLADPAPVEDPGDVPVFTAHTELLAAVRPEVVVICTPPPTHLPIALDALAAECDLLLEKPPVVTLTEHDKLAAAVRAAGRACQVGFQALGSAALTRLIDAVTGGGLGEVTGIAVVASWQRDDAYYARAPWAGKSRVDGALVNPLAHALMQGLAVAGREPTGLTFERYRVRPIETDDTTFARVAFRDGPPLLAAVTLAGEEFIPGEVVVTGTGGTATLEYPTDRLSLPGEPPREVPGRADLLENLLAHRRDPAAVPLIAPLDRTRAFTTVIEMLTAPGQPLPTLLEHTTSTGTPRVVSIRGVNGVLRRAAATLSLPSEFGTAWAEAPRITE